MLPCPLYQLTGIQCPYCGSQRGIAALMDGQWVEAWQYNPFFWLSLPYLFLLLLGGISPRFHERWPLVRWSYDNRVLLSYLALALLWAIVRNVPQ